MILKLERYSYAATETEGELFISSGDKVFNFATIERPWIPDPNGHRGGKRGTPGHPELPASCVPDGAYKLSPWKRPDGSDVYILYAPDLGVWRTQDDPGYDGGRTLCLIHVANWARDVIGCIGPGMKRVPMINPKTGEIAQAVTSSGVAMGKIRKLLGGQQHTLLITSHTGASDVAL